ncbi:MAG: hypothetical protein JSS61_04745 [Verrucomicrobia bacterium]|nr:hypothetical protein [Verrucomicrobiota bacterium]
MMILAASHMQEGVHPELKQINKNEWEVLPSLKEQATALSRLDDATLEQAIPKTEGRRLKRFLGLKRAESSPVMTLQQFKSLLLQENPSEQNKEILSEAYTNFINNQKKMADSGTVTFSIDETPICKLTKEQALDAYEAFLKEPQEKLDDFMTQLRKLNPTIYSQVQQEKRYQEPPSPPESSSSSSSS